MSARCGGPQEQLYTLLRRHPGKPWKFKVKWSFPELSRELEQRTEHKGDRPEIDQWKEKQKAGEGSPAKTNLGRSTKETGVLNTEGEMDERDPQTLDISMLNVHPGSAYCSCFHGPRVPH